MLRAPEAYEGNHVVKSVIEFPGRPLDLATQIERHEGALKVSDVVRYLNLDRSTVYSMVQAGRIPHYRIGDSIRFDPVILADWLRAHAWSAAA